MFCLQTALKELIHVSHENVDFIAVSFFIIRMVQYSYGCLMLPGILMRVDVHADDNC
jgi:hypothetical protein